MLRRAQTSPASSDTAELQPVLRGKVLLAEHQARLTNIRTLVGVPGQHWRCLYLSVFETFAETVQRLVMPVHNDREAESVLRHALAVTELALKIRRGYVLPPDKTPEVVIAEQDLWTYAVATAALLGEVGQAVLGQRTMLVSRDGTPLGLWYPWLGAMTETKATHYRLEPAEARDDQLHSAIAPLLVRHVLPQDGLRWLSSHPDALAAWLGVISQHTIGNPIIMNVIKKARDIACGHDGHNAPRQLPIPGVEVAPGQHIVAAIAAPIGTQEGNLDVNKPTEDVSPTGRTDSPGEQEIVDPGAAFTVWLVEGIRSGALALNTPKARVHVVSEGLLLVSPAVFRLYAGDDWRAAQKRFLKQKLSLKTAAGENFFHYRVDTNRGKKLIKGVLIPNAATKLSLDLPAANPLLSRDTETG